MASEVREHVLRQAGGVPFYLVSYAQSLRAARFAPAGEGIAPGTPAPWDLRQGVRQRAAALSPEARTLLDAAAVAAGPTQRTVLVAVINLPEEAVYAALDEACRARLLVEDGDTYRFAHDVIGEVVEAGVGPARRAGLHRRLARALEALAPAGAPPVETLAYHYERAGEGASAGMWFARAGDRARAIDAPAAAIAAYERALALLPGDGEHRAERLAALEGLGDALERQARYAEAIDAYAALAEAAREAGDGAVEARAWLGMVWTHNMRGEYTQALASAQRAEEVARTAGAELERARALYRQSVVMGEQEQWGRAVALGEQALEAATVLGARTEMAESLDMIGLSLAVLGRAEEAERALARGLALAREGGDRRLIAFILRHLGFAATTEGGDRAMARARFEEALTITREMGDRTRELPLLGFLGWELILQREYAEAEAVLRQAVWRGEEAGADAPLAYARHHLAWALLRQGRDGEARDMALEVLVLARRIGQPLLLGGGVGDPGSYGRAHGESCADRGGPVRGRRVLRGEHTDVTGGGRG